MSEEAEEEDLSSLCPSSSEGFKETDTKGVMLDLCISKGQLGLDTKWPWGIEGPGSLTFDSLN